MAYTGLYDPSGKILVQAVAGSVYTGVMSPDGCYNGVLTVEDTSTKGRYHPCGAYWIKAGTAVGTATDGSTYVTLSSGSLYTINK